MPRLIYQLVDNSDRPANNLQNRIQTSKARISKDNTRHKIFDSSYYFFVFLRCLVIGGNGGLLSTSRCLREFEILLIFVAVDSL